MNLELQVCTLEQAKRLNELGISQVSLFYHVEWNGSILYNPGFNDILSPACFAVFTVGELGVMLPQFSGLNEGGGWDHPAYLDRSCQDGKQWVAVWEYDTDKGYMKTECKTGCTEAEARAAMLIYLLETKTITADEVNKRLEP